MINTLIEKSSNYIAKILECDDDTHDKLVYGFSIIYLNLFKTLLLILISLLLGVFKYAISFLFGYSMLRVFAAGIHFQNDKLCTIVGLISILGAVYLSIYVSLNIYLYFTLFILSFTVYYLYAPAQTQKKPIAKKRIKPLKIKSLLIVLLLFITSYTVGNGVWRSLLTYSVVLEAINILPLTYTLLEGR